ncbi:hypothetical protein EQV77_01115 [Halobacillus fulvus]|nr:hypothetical protein EQV77_01115 [Halobacillus fulvus]
MGGEVVDALKGLGIFIGMLSFLLLSTFGGSHVWEWVAGEESFYEQGTAVAGISLEGMTPEEAERQLNASFEKWINEKDIMLLTSEEQLTFPSAILTPDATTTLETLTQGVDNAFSIEVQDRYEEGLSDVLTNEASSNFQWDAWSEQLERDAAMLTEDPLDYSLYSFLSADVITLYETVAKYEIPAMDIEGLSRVSSSFETIVVEGKSDFSLLESLPSTYEMVDSQALDSIATVLYGAFLKTNFAIEERHTSQRLPAYAELGKEASIRGSSGDDLKIFNPNPSSYQVTISVEGKSLKAVIEGYPLQETISVNVGEKEAVEERTIIQYTSYVDPGQVVVEREGRPGQTVEVYRVSENGGSDLISQDYYPPVNRIELRFGVEGEETNTSQDDENGESLEVEGDVSSDEETPDSEQPTEENPSVENDGSGTTLDKEPVESGDQPPSLIKEEEFWEQEKVKK